MALGLNIVVGFAGLLDLGYVAFVAIGAYTAAYLASSFWADAGPDGQGVAILVSGPVSQLHGIHVNFLLVCVLALAAATVAGALIGVPTLRLRGDYVAIVTLAFGEIIGQVAANGGDIALFGGTLTAGPNNIGPIDKIDLPFLAPFDALDPRPWYWFALGLVALALVVTVRLRDSRIGRAWTALRDDEGAAAAAGIPIARTKLVAYATGAAFGGVSGAFLASYFSAVDAAQFQFSSRSSSSPWSSWEAWARFAASWSAPSSSRPSTAISCPTCSPRSRAGSASASTSRRSPPACTAPSSCS